MSVLIAWIAANILFIGYITYLRWDTYKPYTPSSRLQTITSKQCSFSFQYPNDWTASNDDAYDDPEVCAFTFKQTRYKYSFRIDGTNLTWPQVVHDHATIQPTKIGQHDVTFIPQDVSDDIANLIYIRIGDKVFEADYSKYTDPAEVKILYQVLASGK